MISCELPTRNLPQHALLVYNCHRFPVLKVRANLLSLLYLCARPSISIIVPPGADPERLKHALADWFYACGCEQPSVSNPGDVQAFRQSLAVHSVAFVRILVGAGFLRTFFQDFGMKWMLDNGLQTLRGLPDLHSPHNACDLGRMIRDDHFVFF